MKSLWAQYEDEVLGGRHKYIEKEWGFITYEFLEPDVLHLIHIYVIPERRKEGLALTLVEEAEQIGREAGMKWSLAHIEINRATTVGSLFAHLKAGFVPHHTEPGIIYLKRPIE
jgi:GNAT superfamily N-acetyltransferase